MTDLNTGIAFTEWFRACLANLIHLDSHISIMNNELQIDCTEEVEVIKVAKSIGQIALIAEQLSIKRIRILHRGVSRYTLTVRLALIYPIK